MVLRKIDRTYRGHSLHTEHSKRGNGESPLLGFHRATRKPTGSREPSRGGFQWSLNPKEEQWISHSTRLIDGKIDDWRNELPRPVKTGAESETSSLRPAFHTRKAFRNLTLLVSLALADRQRCLEHVLHLLMDTRGRV